MRTAIWLVLVLILVLGSFSSASALSVYVMDSGFASNTSLVVQALVNAGHSVTTGLQWWQQDGAQSLSSHNVVVFLCSFNWNLGAMGVPGQTEILNFVANGGGLVTGEWFSFNIGAGVTYPLLASLSPAVPNTGFSVLGPTITYNLATPDPVINQGLPSTFAFPADNFSGTEKVFTALGGATTFYTSSNTGQAGLLGWNSGTGRVISFSSIIGNGQMNDPNFIKLFINAVAWSAQQTVPVQEETWGAIKALYRD